MVKYIEKLRSDLRFQEGLNACMNCGVCTAICPAAEFYNYDPRHIVNIVQNGDDETIEELLKSDTIWYCGQCMSCRTRCPRNNTAGYVIQVLRKISQETGLFTESEKGRQQLAIKRVIGGNILNAGYCLLPESIVPEMHPEQGPVWKWIYDNQDELYDQLGANFKKNGNGVLRKIDDESLNELKAIFEVTGSEEFFTQIENHSRVKAKELGLKLDDTNSCDYIKHIYTSAEAVHTC